MAELDKAAAERLAAIALYDPATLRRQGELALDADSRRLYLLAARLIEEGLIGPDVAEGDHVEEPRHVTPQAELGEVLDGGYLEITRCVCGAELEEPTTVGADEELAKPMPCCGARLFFRLEVMLFELVGAGGSITQPRLDHPVWSSEVMQAGPLTITLGHVRDSMLEQGGTFEINSYTRDGNPLVDATTEDGVTLDELVEQQQESGL